MQETEERFLVRARSQRVNLTNSELCIDDCVVVSKTGDGYFVSVVDEECTKDSDDVTYIDSVRKQLNKIADHLNQGRQFEALFLTNFIDWRLSSLRSRTFRKAGFNPAEPRGSHARWTADSSSSLSPVQIAYQGKFHDQVVDDIKQNFEGQSSVVLKGVRVFGLNIRSAIPDGAVKPVGSAPYFFEVKTGFDPTPTDDQEFVYPLICLGGHATSFDPRVSQLGLTPGQPFPPMDIWFVVQGSAKDTPIYFNYCDAIDIRRKFNAP